ncbi:MAG TPA: hypothetical protein VN132_05370 [Bdellovibrio sp.]|nr:hypothetical protein [Bdellovibrio sp.]
MKALSIFIVTFTTTIASFANSVTPLGSMELPHYSQNWFNISYNYQNAKGQYQSVGLSAKYFMLKNSGQRETLYMALEQANGLWNVFDLGIKRREIGDHSLNQHCQYLAESFDNGDFNPVFIISELTQDPENKDKVEIALYLLTDLTLAQRDNVILKICNREEKNISVNEVFPTALPFLTLK